MRLFLIVLMLGLAACATPKRMNAVPIAQTVRAEAIAGPVRYWIGEDPQPVIEEGVRAVERQRAYLAGAGHAGEPLPVSNFLLVSGGGDQGAFGAGLLNGWSQTGTRPEFSMVTGISTGALIAPFAFLGPRYDATLREAYTTVSDKDIYKKRGILAALFEDGMSDSGPMAEMIKRYVTPELLAEIAGEYAKGRLLMVGTTDLDARRPVIWNMTAIAASKDPRALELFRKVVLASASIPGAFPPVMIDVTVDGVRYQEMHVDGGTSAQVFMYPSSLKLAELKAKLNIRRETRVYVIRNARIDPEWSKVDRRTLSIAGRAVSSLIQSQGVGDLYRIYSTAQRDGVDFNLAYIPSDFAAPRRSLFDPEYMRPLYERASRMAREGYPWEKAPPLFDGARANKPIVAAGPER